MNVSREFSMLYIYDVGYPVITDEIEPFGFNDRWRNMKSRVIGILIVYLLFDMALFGWCNNWTFFCRQLKSIPWKMKETSISTKLHLDVYFKLSSIYPFFMFSWCNNWTFLCRSTKETSIPTKRRLEVYSNVGSVCLFFFRTTTNSSFIRI